MSRRAPNDVLMVGWHFKAVDALRQAGRRTISAVSSAELYRVPAHVPRTDLVIVPDSNRAEDVLAGLAREGLAPSDFAAIHTMREFALVTASLLAAHGDTQGLPVDTAVALRDKYVQKKLVRDAGLPTAACHLVDHLADLLGDTPPLPFVVKPLAGAGAFNTHAVRTRAQLEALTAASGGSQGQGPWLVEEFIDGRELHIDGIVREGVLTFLAVSRYLNNVIDIKTGGLVGSVTLHPHTEAACYQQARSLTQHALAALRLSDGIFHLEAFQRGGELVFSECAGRIGGGVVQDTLIHAFGTDLLAEWARGITGQPSTPAAQPHPHNHGWVHLQAEAGRPVRLPSLDALERQPGCVAAGLDLKGSRVIPDPAVSSNQRVAWAVLAGDSEQHVAHNAQNLAAWFHDTALLATVDA
ncbi:acetyl-CoA carboxylase biotin carboxylase subunit family protein [Streptomyces sp. NPDC001828]|uniref:ATP-grasp domain-containing protein n=1 Tax=Streptomyces sp. NPDC001828 TaxID=3364615 RepID=UPI003677D418